MRNIVGKPVTGDNFFDREQEIEAFWERFVDHHLLLRAPRRVGKTSFLRRVEAQAPDRHCTAVYVSAAAWKDEAAFARGLLQACAKKDEAILKAARKGKLQDALKQVQALKVSVLEVALREWPTDAWGALVEELLSQLEQTGRTWILMVDELPVLLHELNPGGDIARVRHFLHWFRSLRERGEGDAGHVRWVLCGSAGLDAFTQRLQLGATVGDLLLFPLDALPIPRAIELFERLAGDNGLQLPPGAAADAVARIGWSTPYFVQLVVHQLGELGGRSTPVDGAALDAAFEALTQPSSRLYFDPWYQRLTVELGRPHDAQARALVTACAKDPEGAPRAALEQVLARAIAVEGERQETLAWLLSVLEGDGYLVRESGSGRYRLRSPLLRAYWLRRVS